MNEANSQKTIWTIGHSNRTFEEFISILKTFKIEILGDIRRYPGSKTFPYFNKEALEISLPANNIDYVHLGNLGGRRKTSPQSLNTGWRLDAFRGYADYMETDDFKEGIIDLEMLASNQRLVYMCSEAVWWSCHRALVSDILKLRGWTVMHIMSAAKEVEHPYTKPAKIINGEIFYTG